MERQLKIINGRFWQSIAMKNNVPYMGLNHLFMNIKKSCLKFRVLSSVHSQHAVWGTELPAWLCDYEFTSFRVKLLVCGGKGGGCRMWGCHLLIIQISNFWKLFLTFYYKYLIKCWCFIFQINSQNFPNKKYFPTLVFCFSSGLAGWLR